MGNGVAPTVLWAMGKKEFSFAYTPYLKGSLRRPSPYLTT